ncbi:MAG: FecR domain-containing protein [Gammaproteobacteria bacterium]
MDANERRLRASEEAAAWFVLLRSDALTPEDRAEFVRWLRESAVHVAEILRVTKVHNALDVFEGWDLISRGEIAAPDNVVSLARASDSADARPGEIGSGDRRSGLQQANTNLHKRLRIFAIAASFVGVLLTAMFLVASSVGQVIRTERGERREVALADGSLLELAPESRVRVRFEPYARYVSLEQGRAVFRVAKNPTRPFSVLAQGTTIRAVGTAFGVERGETGVRVTVSEGKVAVIGPKPSEAGAADAGASEAGRVASLIPAPSRDSLGDSRLFLKAGEQVVVPASGIAEPVRAVDSERELAWAKGRLVFDNESIARAAELFNRYNQVQIRITDVQLAQRPVSGVFDAADPESFIAFIQTGARVRVIRSGSTEITVSKLD